MILRQYRQDLAVAKSFFSLDSSLLIHVRCQILAGDNILSLTMTYFRALRVSTGSSNCFITVPTTNDIASIMNSPNTLIFSMMVQIPQVELNRLLCFQSTVAGPHATRAFLSSNDTHIASSS